MSIWKPQTGQQPPKPVPAGTVKVVLNQPEVGTPVTATHKNGSVLKGYYDGNNPEHTNIFSIRMAKPDFSEVVTVWVEEWIIKLEDNQ